MKLVVRNRYCGIVDEKVITDTNEIEVIKSRYKLWYPITYKEFDFLLED